MTTRDLRGRGGGRLSQPCPPLMGLTLHQCPVANNRLCLFPDSESLSLCRLHRQAVLVSATLLCAVYSSSLCLWST